MAIKLGNSTPDGGKWIDAGIDAMKYEGGIYRFTDNIVVTPSIASCAAVWIYDDEDSDNSNCMGGWPDAVARPDFGNDGKRRLIYTFPKSGIFEGNIIITVVANSYNPTGHVRGYRANIVTPANDSRGYLNYEAAYNKTIGFSGSGSTAISVAGMSSGSKSKSFPLYNIYSNYQGAVIDYSPKVRVNAGDRLYLVNLFGSATYYQRTYAYASLSGILYPDK